MAENGHVCPSKRCPLKIAGNIEHRKKAVITICGECDKSEQGYKSDDVRTKQI